jgi:ring-1,2-phenylacetyl-CoA epoxidase subunit PaaE
MCLLFAVINQYYKLSIAKMFYPLTIKDIRRETTDCVSIAFDIPHQYYEHFQFIQGQYLTLKTTIKKKEIRRSYSICSAPHEGELRIAIKEVPNGVFSTYANRVLKKGDILEVMPPMGHFYTPLSISNEKRYVSFAAGSGITPVISNIKAILHSEPLSICTLIYGNRHVSSIIFKEEIEALKNQNLGRFQVFNVLSRERTEAELLHGRLTKEKINQFFEKILTQYVVSNECDTKDMKILRGDEFFACGPLDMIEAVRDILTEKGVKEDHIHFELFNAPIKKTSITQAATNAINCLASIKIDDLTYDVPIQKGQNILDAAQAMGLDMPYACKGGVCCTCRAKLIEGNIEMQVNYALTKQEVAQGFILTCQAIPQSDRISVDFDVK